MPVVYITPAAPAVQVEDFPAPKGKDAPPFKRSCEGALHLRPGSTRVITADELGHIRKNHKAVARFVRVLVEDKDIPAKKAKPAKQVGPSKPGGDAPDPSPSVDTKGGEGSQEANKGPKGGKGSKPK